MSENKNAEQNKTTQTPYIKRTIDGRVYTVLIHFSGTSKETAQDKIKRLLRNEVANEKFSA